MKKLTLGILLATVVASLTSQAFAQLTVYGLNTGGTSFQTFDTTSPNLLSAATLITGLQASETIAAIDFRPFDQQLYGYSNQNRVYRITNAGAATVVTFAGTATTAANGTGSDTPSTLPAPGAQIRIDVNPNVPPGGIIGALRVVDTDENNLRYAFAGTGTLNFDDKLTVSGGGALDVVGVAYTNPDTNTDTGTALYYINAADDSLYTTGFPNDGLLITPLALGISIPTSDVGFDVPLFGTNNAFVSVNDSFYSITIGVVSSPLNFIGTIGAIGVNEIIDIAIIPEPSTNLLLLSAGIGAVLLVRRRKTAVS